MYRVGVCLREELLLKQGQSLFHFDLLVNDFLQVSLILEGKVILIVLLELIKDQLWSLTLSPLKLGLVLQIVVAASVTR